MTEQLNKITQSGNYKNNHPTSFFEVYSSQKQSNLIPQNNHQEQPFKISEKQIEDQPQTQQTTNDPQQTSIASYQSSVNIRLTHKEEKHVNQENLDDEDTSQLIQNPYYSVKKIPKLDNASINRSNNLAKSITSSQTSRISYIQDQSKSKILQMLLACFDQGDAVNKIPDKFSDKSVNFKQNSKIASEFLTNLKNQKNKLEASLLSPKGKKIGYPGIEQIPQEESFLERSRSQKQKVSLQQHKSDLSVSKSNTSHFVSFIQSQNFLIIPISKNRSFQFYLKREAKISGCLSKTEYHLYQVNDFKYLVSAQESLNKFSLVRKKQSKINQIGQLSRSICGKKFQCFYFPKIKVDQSKTNKPLKQTKAINKTKNTANNVQLLSIKYETNLLGVLGPRKLQVYIPKINHIIKNQTPLYELCQKTDMIQKFVSKEPRYNEEIGCYKLDFKSRTIVESKKNFQILSTDKQNKPDISLKQTNNIFNQYLNKAPNIYFSKLTTDLFHLQIQYPFSILQGFCLALSSFGNKI